MSRTFILCRLYFISIFVFMEPIFGPRLSIFILIRINFISEYWFRFTIEASLKNLLKAS